MSDQEINRTLAEACGWKFEQTEEGGKITYPCGFVSEFSPISWAEEKFLKTISDYCNDLNAMHEAENNFPHPSDWYQHNLALVCGARNLIYRATARQRAEAFLRVFDKWKEEA